MSRDKRVLPFIRRDVNAEREGRLLQSNLMLSEAIDLKFERVIVLGQDKDGFWYFRCSAGIDKVTMIGMLEFTKAEIFASMEQGMGED